MKQLTNYILDTYILSYDANEFIPVRDMDGKLANKHKFVYYKAKRAIHKLSTFVHN